MIARSTLYTLLELNWNDERNFYSILDAAVLGSFRTVNSYFCLLIEDVCLVNLMQRNIRENAAYVSVGATQPLKHLSHKRAINEHNAICEAP